MEPNQTETARGLYSVAMEIAAAQENHAAACRAATAFADAKATGWDPTPLFAEAHEIALQRVAEAEDEVVRLRNKLLTLAEDAEGRTRRYPAHEGHVVPEATASVYAPLPPPRG